MNPNAQRTERPPSTAIVATSSRRVISADESESGSAIVIVADVVDAENWGGQDSSGSNTYRLSVKVATRVKVERQSSYSSQSAAAASAML